MVDYLSTALLWWVLRIEFFIISPTIDCRIVFFFSLVFSFAKVFFTKYTFLTSSLSSFTFLGLKLFRKLNFLFFGSSYSLHRSSSSLIWNSERVSSPATLLFSFYLWPIGLYQFAPSIIVCFWGVCFKNYFWLLSALSAVGKALVIVAPLTRYSEKPVCELLSSISSSPYSYSSSSIYSAYPMNFITIINSRT